MFRKPRTLRATLLRAALVPVGFFAGLGTVYAVTGSVAHLTFSQPASRPLSAVATMVRDHDCWTGPAPSDMAGRMPGHVVVTTADGRLRYSSRLVGPALEQVFNGAENHLTVHAFCR
jgi:hypothetical protein